MTAAKMAGNRCYHFAVTKVVTDFGPQAAIGRSFKHELSVKAYLLPLLPLF